MTVFLVKYSSTGAITEYIECPDSAESLQSGPTGGGILSVDQIVDFASYSQANYIANSTVVSRISQNITMSGTTLVADGTSEVTITGIANNSTAIISGVVNQSVTITDGELTITSNLPGAINISIFNEPTYLVWTGTINAS